MKAFKTFIACVLLVSTIFTFSACFFGGSGNDNGMFNKTEDVELTLHNDDESKTVTVRTGSTAFVELFHKPGYSFKGYFSKEEGGEQYFDGDGKSLVSWKKEFPTELYAQWESIYDMSFKSGTFYTKEEASYGGIANIYDLPKEFVKVIENNPSAKMKIIVEFDAKYSSNWNEYPVSVDVREIPGIDGEILDKESKPLSDQYQSYRFELVFDAHKLINDEFYLFINNNGSRYYVCMYVKNFTYTLAFVE